MSKTISSAKTPAIPVDPNSLKKLKTTLGIFIATFAFMLYAQSISFNYTQDDPYILKENSLTRQGIKAIPMILTTDYWYGIIDKSFRGPVYRPIPLILFAIEWQSFPDNPSIYHFINVLLFSLTCWLMFLLLSALFEKQSLIYQVVFPFVCSLLFAAHPIHTEVVDSIKSADELLCFLFAIIARPIIVLPDPGGATITPKSFFDAVSTTNF